MTSAPSAETWFRTAQATARAVAVCFCAATAVTIGVVAFSAPASATTEADFTDKDVNAAVDKVIAARSKDGVFVFRDPKLNADLHLVFEKVKIDRGMKGYGWFANVIFHDKDEPKKQYAIDFWFKPEGKELKLMDIRVQKGPKREGDGWVMITRLPVAWWWLPVQEHPGDMEVTRAWQVMSAIHKYIATHKDARMATSTSRTTRPARPCPSNSSRSTSRCVTSRRRASILPAPTSASPAVRTSITTSISGWMRRPASSKSKRQDTQGPCARRRHLDPSAALQLRRHGY